MGKIKNKEAWNLLKQFPIGTKVIVSSVMNDVDDNGSLQVVPVTDTESHIEFRGRRHRWVPVPCDEFEAWVSGAKWLCDGKVETDHYGGGNGYEDYEPPYDVTFLAVTKKTPVLLVRRAMFSKEIAVPVDGVQSADFAAVKGTFLTPPSPLTRMPRLSEDHPYRKTMREEMKKWPRDANGRWRKP
jgi:hypothetical protein